MTFLIDLEEFHQKEIRKDQKVASAYGTFKFPGQPQPEKPKDEEYTTMKEKWIRALVKPASATVVLMVMMLALRKK